MKYIFWVLFASETLFMLWMLWEEMKLRYLTMPAYIPVGFLWLILILILKFVIKSNKIAFIMVVIPAIPLIIMLMILIAVYISKPTRLN